MVQFNSSSCDEMDYTTSTTVDPVDSCDPVRRYRVWPQPVRHFPPPRWGACQVGSTIPIIYHHLLRQDFLLLKYGDYTALEKYDPAENDEPGEPTYIIVQIKERINCDTSVAPYNANYSVDIGGGQSAVVSAALLYVFRQPLTSASCTTSAGDGSEDTEFEMSHQVDYDYVINDLKITTIM